MASRDDQAISRASRFAAFVGGARIAEGALADVATVAKRAQDEDPWAPIIAFDRETGEVADLDLRGAEQDVAARYARADKPAAGRGRPKLGVVAREVTLLPRHWDWLARQPGGASVTLRRLLDAARKSDSAANGARAEAAYRFLSSVAGDLPGFEEAARVLFAGDRNALAARLAPWPPDIGDEVLGYLDGRPAGGEGG